MKPYHCILHAAVMLSLFAGTVFAQEQPSPGQTEADPENDSYVVELHKRLGGIITELNLKPESDGSYEIIIDSGYFNDDYERQKYVYYEKAIVTAPQGSVTRIIIEYYQFSLVNQLKEIKTLVNSSPGSQNLGDLLVTYTASDGESSQFFVKDLSEKSFKVKVVTQYRAYLIDLLQKMENYETTLIKREKFEVDRIINLGNQTR